MKFSSWLGVVILIVGTELPLGRVAAQAVDECTQSRPAWIFCSGFEEGNLDIWDDYDDNPPSTNAIIAHPGPFGLDGNHVMRLTVPAGSGGADLVKVLPTAHDRLYARWYILWEPGYDFSAPNHGGGLHAGDRGLLGVSGYRPTGTDRFSAIVDVGIWDHRPIIYAYYPGMYQDCYDPEGQCWGDHFPCTMDEGQGYCTNPAHRETTPLPVLETGRWYCVEILMDGGTPTSSPLGADGVLDIWIDGVEYGPWTGLWMRSTPDLKVTILWLSVYFHGAHSTAGILLDNVVVSTAAIGLADGLTGVDDPKSARSWGSVKAGFW
jgi:hypothetical protein